MSDLNDFFARKDRKKLKNTNKFTTMNDIDKKLKEMDLKKEKALRHSSDDEWKRFEEKKIDYTGLKIQNSTLQEDDGCSESEKDVEETSCPWRTGTQSQGNVEVQENSSGIQEVPAQLEKPIPTVKAYIPPHLRNKPAKPASTDRHNRLRGNSSCFQDENVENMFPSLPTVGSASLWQNKTKVHETPLAPTNSFKLALENKFGTLNSRRD